jgi:hypothetical protein
MGIQDLKDRADKAVESFEDKTGVDVKPDKGQDGTDSTESKESEPEPEPENDTESEPEPDANSSNTDTSQDTNPAVDRLRSSLGIGDGGGGGSSAGDSTDEIRENTDVEDARDPDIIKQNPEDGDIIESAGERVISRARNAKGELGSKNLNQSVRADQFLKSKKNLNEAQESEERIESRIDKVRNDNANRYNLEGKDKVLTENELLDKLKQDKRQLQNTQREIKNNQNQRLENIGEVSERIDRENEVITEKEAAARARTQDLSKQGGQLQIFNKKVGGQFKGPAAEAGIVADALLSKRSGEVIGAAVTGDKTVEQVAEKNAILASQRVEDGFNPVQEGADVIGSVPGIIGTTIAGGALFSGAGKVIGSKLGSGAKTAFTAGGAAAGGIALTNQVGKATRQARQGKEAKAVGTTVNTVAGLGGFRGGQKGFTRRFGFRQGSTRIQQKNLLTKTGQDTAKGFGKFTAQTKVNARKFTDTFRSGNNPTTKTIVSRGKLKLDSSKQGGQAKGVVRFEGPDGQTKKQTFEALSNQKTTGTTVKGNKFKVSSDTVRFKSEGRLFNNFKDVETETKSVIRSRSDADPERVAAEFEGAQVQKQGLQKVKSTSVNKDSDTFSSTINIIQGRNGGGSTGSTGTKLQGQSKSDVDSTTTNVEDVIEDQADSFTSKQNTKNIAATSNQDTQSQQSGNQAGGQSSTSFVESDTTDNELTAQANTVQDTSTETEKKEENVNQATGVTTDTGTSVTNSTVTNTVNTSTTGQETRQDTGQTSKTVNKPVDRPVTKKNQGNRPGQATRNTQKTAPVTGLQFSQGIQPEITNQGVNQGIQTSLLQGTATATSTATGIGGGLGFNQETGTEQGTGLQRQETGTGQGTDSTLSTDWFSANLVEQETGEEATFNVSQNPENELFGLKTSQEQSGKVEQPKIISQNGGLI